MKPDLGHGVDGMLEIAGPSDTEERVHLAEKPAVLPLTDLRFQYALSVS